MEVNWIFFAGDDRKKKTRQNGMMYFMLEYDVRPVGYREIP